MAAKPARRNLIGARADEEITLASDAPANAAQVENVLTTMIRTNGGTQMRAAINPETVDGYKKSMQEGTQFPPIVLYYDGSDYWVGDGFHRLAAHREVHGQTATIAAKVHAGGQRDAVLHAAGANAAHGLPRSNADKRRAVETLLRDEEWGTWSDREIARRCKVHHSTVAAIRSDMVASGGIRQIEERTVERGGTIYTQAAKTPPPASIADLEAGLLGWLPTMFEDEADWPGVLADIQTNGLGAFPSLRQALPECSATALRLAAEEAAAGLRQDAAAAEATAELYRRTAARQQAAPPASRVVIEVLEAYQDLVDLAAEEPIIIACPSCGAEQEDLDGFGVIHCEACGYCVHPSSTGGVCDICGETVPVSSDYVGPEEVEEGDLVADFIETTPRGVQVGNVSRSLHATMAQLSTYSDLTGDFETPVRLRREAQAMLDKLAGLLSALDGGD